MNIKFICDVKIFCWRSTFLTKSTMVTAVHFDGGEFLFIDINCECTWPAAAVVGFNQLLLNQKRLRQKPRTQINFATTQQHRDILQGRQQQQIQFFLSRQLFDWCNFFGRDCVLGEFSREAQVRMTARGNGFLAKTFIPRTTALDKALNT